jgi:UDPglucose--hexose-1-phosphate uridylyltransferase
MIQQELAEAERLIRENKSFVALCPFVSSFPFETWIMPKAHSSDFASISPELSRDLSRIIKEVLTRMRLVLSDPPYNFVINTGPLEPREREEYHWHVELIPKLTTVAGFEWGTGFYVNPTPPELAAQALQDVALPV